MPQYILTLPNPSKLSSSGDAPKGTVEMAERHPLRFVRELLGVNENFKSLLDGMAEGILEISAKGRIVYANRNACLFTGKPEEKLLNTQFIELFSESDRPRVDNFLKTTEPDHKNFTEKAGLSIDGHRFALNLLSIKREDRSNFIAILNPAKAHQALRESRDKTDLELKKTIAEPLMKETHAPHQDEILVVDDDELVLRAFRDILEYYGYKVDAVSDTREAEQLFMNRTYDVIFSDISMPEMNGIELLEKIRENQPDTPVIMFTGMATVETAADAVRLGAYDYLKKPVGSEMLVNLTKRAVETKKLKEDKKRLEKENLSYQADLEVLVAEKTRRLWHQKELLENILESLTHPFYVVNTNDYTIEMANSATKPDYSKAEGLTCHRFSYHRDDPCDGKDHPCPIKEAKKTKQPVCVEIVHFNSQRSRSTIEVHAYPLFDDGGNVAQVILYKFDISERKRLESIAEAKNLMDNIGYVFSGIRHELGNPINSLKMALSVLNENLDTFDEETVNEFMARSLDQVRRVESLLKALQNFSLFEKPKVENVRIDLFMENFCALVIKDLENKGVDIKIGPFSREVWARTDPRAFQQVLLNLVTNAADACEGRDDSEIIIEVLQQKDHIAVVVKDNGCGMSEDQKQDLYKPFITSKMNGTGLGLVIVKKMLTAMKSVIDIKSRVNKGTAVTLTLPEGDSESG